MSTLSTSIVELGFATERDVEEALARQVMYGGELGSNLLELGVVSEAQLVHALSHSTGLDAAPAGELPRTPESLRGRVPVHVSSQLGVHLFGEEEGMLLFAVADLLPAHVTAQLLGTVGGPLRQLIAPRVRVQQAVAREYGIRLPERALLILRRLEGRASVPPAARGLSVDFKQMPRPQSVPPLAFASAPTGSFEDETAPPPEDYVELMATAVRAPKKAAPEQAEDAPARALPRVAPLRSQRRGPYTAAMAERDLLSAETRDDVAAAFFDFAAQYFEYAALFVISGDEAVGRDARGPGSPVERVRAMRVPLDVPSVLSKVRDDRSWHLGRLRAGGLEGGLARDLDRPVGRKALVLPIVVRNRAVFVLYGDHGALDVELTAVGDLISFSPLAASALERVILDKKRGQRAAQLGGPAQRGDARRKGTAPSREQKARAFADLLGADERASRPPPAPHHEPLANEARAWNERPSSTPPFPAQSAPTLPGFPQRPIVAAEGESEQSPAAQARARIPTAVVSLSPTPFGTSLAPRPSSDEPPEDGWDDEAMFAPSESNTELGVGPRHVVSVSASPTPLGPAVSRKTTQRDFSPAPATVSAPTPDMPPVQSPTPPAAQSPTPPPVQSPTPPPVQSAALPATHESPSIESSALFEHAESTGRGSMRPTAPEMDSPRPSAFVPSHTPHASVPNAGPRRLSAKMVAAAGSPAEWELLVDALCAGDDGALRELLAAGDQAVGALVARFPGPVSVARRDATTRASDCGPVLHALSRLGKVAVPYLTVRTADEDATIREWATRLLGELPSRESAEAIARRLVDDVVDVRRAALAAARMLQNHPEARDGAQGQLEELATDAALPASVRRAAIEALTDLRQKQATPRMIELLDDPDREVSSGARWSLMVLSRQDFGADRTAWTRFWEANQSKHRIEWLIDSLTHENRDIRRAAGDELKSVTREYFGYYDDLPEAERVRAQTRYREWWDAEGKRRFV
jgi:hypothetical protein